LHLLSLSPAHGSGAGVMSSVGAAVGVDVTVVGFEDEVDDGNPVELPVGSVVAGAKVGMNDWTVVGFEDGINDGNPVKLLVGAVVTGANVGMNDGTTVGFSVGVLTGESVVVGTEIGELVEHSSKKNLV